MHVNEGAGEQRFLIRTATEQDVLELRRLIESSVRGLQKDDYSQEQMDGALGHALGLDTQLITDRTYFAVMDQTSSRIVASGGWSFRKTLFGSDGGPGRAAEVLDPATGAAKIRAIFVHPECARMGLGSRVLLHCETAAWRAGFRRVEMGSTLTGLPLYLKKGYVPGEPIAVPLPNGESLAIVPMTKRLLATF